MNNDEKNLALEEEVLKVTSNQENEFVQQVITELKPIVIGFIHTNVSSSEDNLSNIDHRPYIQVLSETILIQLRPVVRGEVNNALR